MQWFEQGPGPTWPGHYSGKAILYTLQACFIYFGTTEQQQITVVKATAH